MPGLTSIVRNLDLPAPSGALREVLAAGYHAGDLRADVLAGLVVGVVAIPLSMALAIAVGVPPQYGLATAVVAGAVIAIGGGSRFQVSGPTAAFVVVLAPIVSRFGVGGLMLATIMSGAVLSVLGLARLGRLVQFVPSPVTTGFTAGIAVVIATLQVKDLLGLTVVPPTEGFPNRVVALVAALPTARFPEVAIGTLTLLVLIVWPMLRLPVRIPSPLIALTIATAAATLAAHLVPELEVATIASRFRWEVGGLTGTGIPPLPPHPLAPWLLPGPDGRPLGLSLELLRALAPSALAIAALGAIESLLSAVVADGLTGTSHDPDAELLAQGLGNMVAPFFGAIAATGAIARTATNIRAGGRSPIAAVVHSVVVLVAMVAAAPVLGRLPMAALAALLMVVAWNMAELPHALRSLRTSPRGDALVLLSCFALTVIFDMVVAVTVGVVLAAFLFMRRMAVVAGTVLVAPSAGRVIDVPAGVVAYEVAGPLFFGAAAKAMGVLATVDPEARVVVLDLSAVPVIDATGLVNLDTAVRRLQHRGVVVVLAGVGPHPLRTLTRAGWRNRPGRLVIRRSRERGLEMAARHVAA